MSLQGHWTRQAGGRSGRPVTTDNSGLFSHQQEEEIIPAPCCVGLSGGSGRTYKRGPESELPVKVHPPVWAGRLGGAAGRWCVRCAPWSLRVSICDMSTVIPSCLSHGAGEASQIHSRERTKNESSFHFPKAFHSCSSASLPHEDHIRTPSLPTHEATDQRSHLIRFQSQNYRVRAPELPYLGCKLYHRKDSPHPLTTHLL